MAMDQTDNIRSMRVIAHADHGKSMSMDSVFCKAGIILAKAAGEARFIDTRADEQECGVATKSAGVSLYIEHDEDDSKDYTPHLVDSPGHVDFLAEATAALRIIDGAMTVVDVIEDGGESMGGALCQFLADLMSPHVLVYKADWGTFELHVEVEDIYGRFRKAIEEVSVIIAAYNDMLVGNVQVNLEKGTVVFGNGLRGWVFNV